MNKLEEIKKMSAEVNEIIKKYHADKAYVFGSCARQEDNSRSDVDILVDLLPGASLFDLMDIQDSLENLLKRKVDVVSKRGLNPYLRDDIIREAVMI